MYHVTLKNNVRKILRQGLIPQTGDRAADLGESEDGIYLFKTAEDVETAMSNWMGEEFEDDELALLEVTLPPGAKTLPTTAEYEVVVVEPIPPQYIKLVTDPALLQMVD